MNCFCKILYYVRRQEIVLLLPHLSIYIHLDQPCSLDSKVLWTGHIQPIQRYVTFLKFVYFPKKIFLKALIIRPPPLSCLKYPSLDSKTG